MAGHTRKWAKVKRKKKKDDRRKSRVWARLSQEIETAARNGGGDPDANVALSQALERARDEDMAKDTIERAIKRGTGEIEEEGRERVTYEGYAPHGVAVFVEGETENINRTVKDLRNLFSDHGGNLGKDGSVAYLFEQKGRLAVPTGATDEMTLFEVAVEAGAEEIDEADAAYIVTTRRDAFADVEAALDEAGIAVEANDLVRSPTTTVTLAPDEREAVEDLVEKINDLRDVEAVYTTLQIDGVPLTLGVDVAPPAEH
ncbi:YebC/PmpR family DNA-binding transcriptional regulator [Salinibacter altiplanensis]|uniref:YebC/PmpR family DNA-binding transcriptional regulator n=1 Tax=Salinibacter altiplanensis TaxID=1803181 RepID=UPI000C9F4A9E|nr:YebC/PmpR family DNA-binding transcriptional regulator [Salinibacter altiplanensis]